MVLRNDDQDRSAAEVSSCSHPWLANLVSEAPAELWMRPSVSSQESGVRWYQTALPDEPDVVRYVRADLYEALQARLAVVRSWGDAPCLAPLP